MHINVKTAVVLAAALVVGFGQPLSAQPHPSGFFAESAEGPIARAAAIEIAKLEQIEPAAEFHDTDAPSRVGDVRNATPVQLSGRGAQSSRRGPIIGAVIGVAVGALVGTGLAINYATRQCGSSCSDERAMMWISAVGVPIGAGVAGYYLGKLGS